MFYYILQYFVNSLWDSLVFAPSALIVQALNLQTFTKVIIYTLKFTNFIHKGQL